MVDQPRTRLRRSKPDGPHPIDIVVGGRMRGRRILLGMSQEELGVELGITFQQVQKYEKGANRISASRLYDISQALDVSPSYFFQDMDTRERPARSHASRPTELDPLDRRETLELVRAYYRIDDLAVRQEIAALVRSLAR